MATLLLQMAEDFQIVGTPIAHVDVLNTGRRNANGIDDPPPDVSLARAATALVTVLLLRRGHAIEQFLANQSQHGTVVRVNHRALCNWNPYGIPRRRE
ncbi:MAG: hypothetical protein U0894_01285 [Pirellulales bacterium]